MIPRVRPRSRVMQFLPTALLLLLVLPGCFLERPRVLPDYLSLLTRSSWNAATPVLPMQRHTPRRITIHHTGTPQAAARTTADKLRALQRFSQERSALASGRIKEPWADVPYHFYIAVDGTIAEGREIGFIGDSNTDYDLRGHILIVVEGNFEQEFPTPGQYESLWKLTYTLARQWQIAPALISGHRDHAPTACPGRVLYAWLPSIRERLSETLPMAAGESLQAR
jgi:hypothetical protein